MEDERHALGVGRQEDTGPGDAWRLDPLHFFEELLEGQPQLQRGSD